MNRHRYGRNYRKLEITAVPEIYKGNGYFEWLPKS